MPPPAAGAQRREELAHRRRSLGHTQQSLAEAIGVTSVTIAGWERGSAIPLPRHRPRLAQVLQMTVVELARMIEPDANPIVLNGHEVPGWLSHYESLVHAAGWLGEVESVAIPGLLQTKRYTEVVERATENLLTDEQVQDRIDLRQARQAALHRRDDPLHLTAVLPEHLLLGVIGSPDVMSEQLDHLSVVAQLPNVELLVLPADERSVCFVNGFELLARRRNADPFMVVTADVEGPHYVEDPDRVAKFVRRFRHLVESALTPFESTRRIQHIRENHP